MFTKILYTFLFKALRGVLAGIFGWAVTKGYMTSGQTEYVLEAAGSGVLWFLSAFVSSALHNLKIRMALDAEPDKDFSFAELRAAAWSAVVDTLKGYVRKLLNRKDSDEKGK
jgi:hypothetical protein